MKKRVSIVISCFMFTLLGCTEQNNFAEINTIVPPEVETGDNEFRGRPLQRFIEETYSGAFICDRDLENYLFYNFTKLPYKNDTFILHLNISRYERTPFDNVTLCEKDTKVLLITQTEATISLIQSFEERDIPQDMQEILGNYPLGDTMYQRALEKFSVSKKEYGKCSEEICGLIGEKLYLLSHNTGNILYEYYSKDTSGVSQINESIVLGENHLFSLEDANHTSYKGYRQFINQNTIGYRLLDKPEMIYRKELQILTGSNVVSFYTLYPNMHTFY